MLDGNLGFGEFDAYVLQEVTSFRGSLYTSPYVARTLNSGGVLASG
jgi:hypothetical protein